MVWIDRLALWELVYDGEHGVVNALKILEEKLREYIMLLGSATLKDMGPHLLVEARHGTST